MSTLRRYGQFIIHGMRLVVILALLQVPGAGWAQVDNITNSSFLSSTWFRVGPTASHFNLQRYLEEKLPSLARTGFKSSSLPLGQQIQQIAFRYGINPQVLFIVWYMSFKQNEESQHLEYLQNIAQVLNSFEGRRAWGDQPTTILAADGRKVHIPDDLNPSSAAVLAALSTVTSGETAQFKIDSGRWAAEFGHLFRIHFGDPLDTPDRLPANITDGFRLPFSGRNTYNSGPHATRSTQVCLHISPSEGSGLDFNAPDVLAVADGEVIAIQNENLGHSIGKSVAIRHQTNAGQFVTMYWHLESISATIARGMYVQQGTYLGRQGKGYNNAFSPHLHLELRTFNPQHDYMSIDTSGTPISWVGRTIDSYRISSIFDSRGALNYEGVAFRDPGKSLTFANSQFPCVDGQRRTVSTSVNNQYDKIVIDNFYEHTVFANVNPAFRPAYLNSTNGAVCPAESAGCNPNRPPNTPSLSSPGDWHVQRDGRAPTLCWRNNGDLDGDPVEFYAEVYQSAVNASSGWQSKTCWPPKELDGHYYGYQWRVKARDSRGAESGWSETWHFTIEASNEPPRIDFQTSNGNGAGHITSRERDWTFRGTASDPEGRLSRVEFRCDDCDNRGSGDDRATSTNWTIRRNGMSGRNVVYFQAYDDRHSTRSRTVQLDIDLAAPTTGVQINGQAPGAWPQWFTTPAQVTLTARDNSTGRANAGVKEVRYRLDDGSWQTRGGSTVSFTVSQDGVHTLRYYAVDNVGNGEGERSVTFRVDRTPPTGISGVRETHGVAHNTWQKDQNKPTFTWDPSTDGLSGLGGYQFYFGPDPNGAAVHFDVGAEDARSLTPNNLGVATGTYYLRGRTWDKAGNKSAWQTLFTFKYDGTPPPNPGEATHADGPKNDVWQKITARPNFAWTPPTDEGSGLKGYFVYWGTNENGESSNFITANSFQSNTPLCGQGQACVGYLRLRSQDNVGLQAEKWSTTFVLRYDGAPPVADFVVNGGVTVTNQSLVTLDIRATDQGSGLREMRLSSDGVNWTPWEAYNTSRVWEIPAISRQSWPIYLQVKDAVGWESAVVSRTVYFDVNVDQPRSQSYRLFDYAQVAGAGSHASTAYRGRSTVGQVADSPRIQSASYRLVGGYEAGSQAIPLVVPGHDEFEFINGIFASGVVNGTMQSGQYRMVGVWGEPALPNNRTEIASASYRFQPGFLAAQPSPKGTPTPAVTPTPGPTPTPTPTPECEFPTVSINNGAVFTRDTAVTLSLCAPNAVEMMVSNDGGFQGATWEPYARTKAWTLTGHGNYVLPRFVYVVFKDAAGQVYGTYMDDIILDPVPPKALVRVGTDLPLDEAMLVQVREQAQGRAVGYGPDGTLLWLGRSGERVRPLPLLRAKADGTVDLYLSARDEVGNVAQMEISEDGTFQGNWERYEAYRAWTPPGGDGVKTVYARFQDEAGNVTEPVTATFVLDTQPPIGSVALADPVLGPDVVTTTIWLSAEDNLSGVADMRISTDPAFTDAVWRPYTPTLSWTFAREDYSRQAIYVQYRDAAANVSKIYSYLYITDFTPPEVYVEVGPGKEFTRTLQLYVYDELTWLDQVRLTNDPLFLEGVVTQPYSDTLAWVFDERQVVWVQVKDGVGNWSEPYPAYAELSATPTPTPEVTLTPTPEVTPTPAPAEHRLYLPSVSREGRGARAGETDSGEPGAVYLPSVEAAPPPSQERLEGPGGLEWYIYLPLTGR